MGPRESRLDRGLAIIQRCSDSGQRAATHSDLTRPDHQLQEPEHWELMLLRRRSCWTFGYGYDSPPAGWLPGHVGG